MNNVNTALPGLNDRPLWIIMSGAYVDQEIAAELGKIPPSLMPIGNARLYQLQLNMAPAGARIYLVLPESFDLPTEDQRFLRNRDVTVIPLPENLSLGNAVVFAFNCIGAGNEELHILHGDTLIRDIAPMPDAIAVAREADQYSWAYVDVTDGMVSDIQTASNYDNGELRPAACGYFSFSSGSKLVKSIVLGRGDFVEGLNRYVQQESVKALDVRDWLDFGHLQSFFRSRRTVSTARVFNDITISGEAVRKTSRHNAGKIRAEANWLRTVPVPLRTFCSRVVDEGEGEVGFYYDTEYEYLLTLAEIYLFGSVNRAGWERIAAACEAFLRVCASHTNNEPANAMITNLTIDKTLARLEDFGRETGFNINRDLKYDGHAMPSLVKIAESLASNILPSYFGNASIMHGDFCFSNIFYNTRAHRVRVIDPRGFVRPGEISIYGHFSYDLAKLSHSVIGRYDQILAGRYQINGRPEGDVSIEFDERRDLQWIEGCFGAISVADKSLGDDLTLAMMTTLFLSMLPLHSDRPDRQDAFIANAVRLYRRFS